NATHTEVKTALITVYPLPQVDFTAPDAEVCVGEPFRVNSQAGPAPGGAPLTLRQWDFGDGGGASGPTATRAYPAAGSFTVSLTVRDANGCTETKAKPGFALVRPLPQVAFTANQTQVCAVPASIRFSNQSGTGA